MHANCVASTTGHVVAGVAGKVHQVAVSLVLVISIPSVPKKKKMLVTSLTPLSTTQKDLGRAAPGVVGTGWRRWMHGYLFFEN